MNIDLPMVWAGIIALGLFLYVMLDGFDLGIGLIFPFFEKSSERQVLLNTVAPVWDGNETFMVLGGAGLYGAFPVAYATLLPANYLPVVLMLAGLIFRGAAFELRGKAKRSLPLWDLAFIFGSVQATFFQGVLLGSLLQGIKIHNGQFVGAAFDWMSPFSIFCGLGLMFTYAVLGCGWLIIKTDGMLQERMYALMKPLTFILLGVIMVVSAWTALGQPTVAQRWFTGHNLLYFLPVPLLVLVSVWGIFRAVDMRIEAAPFRLALLLLFLGYTGFIISIWPNIIPPSLTIWEASATHSSQLFSLVGTVIILPIILVYSYMQYRVFRGKVREGDHGYH
ncbi:cytochrome d ubiquinol oxidase subunit II [Solilutibacter silvestris]|uniref:CydB: cytochrome d ubiquinol oxidase, subunit II n=1 Tax=Solilutibacter silvestris TaxID=1645665 RepID=A0A2K1Q392_9GAMM|nr:cytochrome d ubiquinol oxidase subunit II [Lysobacter silvestris]PNS09471.1 cydB: cytochrome d ubiquinol oxidase, subunit II [Lysobacter silvestris]